MLKSGGRLHISQENLRHSSCIACIPVTMMIYSACSGRLIPGQFLHLKFKYFTDLYAFDRFFLTTSKDMTAKLYTLDPVEGYRPKTFAGHRDSVLSAQFSKDGQTIYTVSRDGACFVWKQKSSGESDADEDMPSRNAEQEDGPVASTSSLDHPSNSIAATRWGVAERFYFQQTNSRVVSVAYHIASSILVVGFSTGVFGLWEMPAFTQIHTLSISQEKISSVAINPSGEWLAFGASKLGQLLVWEWQSESYILKQQGHYYDMNCLAFSPEDGGQHVVTGGDDGKVKIWNAASGFCFVTFSEHSSAITAVEFAKGGQVVFSASQDGTVRAFDMVRYRNFRTFLPPESVQFNSMAVDPSGEIVAAAGSGSSGAGFEIFVWSTQTGKVVETLTGHEGPVSGLAFSPNGDRLASCSWDGFVRTWELYGRRNGATEPFQLGSDALSVAWRPDGKELAATTLNGQIVFFDPIEGRQTGIIEGRRDISGGRKADDRRTAANSESGKSFTSIAYTADGSCVIAGGNSKHVCLYDIAEGVLLKRWEISQNLALDGTQEFLDSRRLTADGTALDLLDETGEASDQEDRINRALPGARKGDMSKRKYRPEARTSCIRFSPAGRAWAAASTEGLLLYSLDGDQVAFDPFDLDVDITPESIQATLDSREYLKALVMAFRLNEQPIIRTVYEAVPSADIPLLAQTLPVVYSEALLRFIAGEMEKGSRHVEFNLKWTEAVLASHGAWLKQRSGEVAATLRSLQKGLLDCQAHVAKTSVCIAFRVWPTKLI